MGLITPGERGVTDMLDIPWAVVLHHPLTGIIMGGLVHHGQAHRIGRLDIRPDRHGVATAATPASNCATTSRQDTSASMIMICRRLWLPRK
jgi:hypothetical protein